MYLEELREQNSWSEVMNRIQKQISRLNPQWTDYNLHDPGITLLELFAWMQQVQIYHAKQIGEQHRRKYAKLLGMEAVRRKPGQTFVTVSGEEDRYLEAGTRFYAGDICFETREGQRVAEGIFAKFITCGGGEETVLGGDWMAQGKGVSLFPFGQKPVAGDEFIIELLRPLQKDRRYCLFLECFHRYPVKRIPVSEDAYDGHGFYPLSAMRMEYLSEYGWKLLQVLRDETYGMTQDGNICFQIRSPMDSSTCRLRFHLERSDYLPAPHITRISLAMVKVWQQETLSVLPWFLGDGFPEQRHDTKERQLDLKHLEVCVEDPEEPGRMVPWQRVEDFDGSGPENLHYMVEGGVLLFGDGFRGMMPEGRIQVRHMVRTLGDAGNIKAGTISRMEPDDASCRVTNEYDVTGGTGEETIEEVLERYQREHEIPQRAVTYKDYETLVKCIPGLLIEDCSVYSLQPEKREIIIAVKPYAQDGHGLLNEAYQKNLYRYLEEKRIIGTRIRIISPEYYELHVTCVISAKVQYRDAGKLVEEVIAGWVKKKRFGEGILYRELVGLIDSLPYVQKVDSMWLNAGNNGKRNQLGDVQLPPEGLFHLKSVSCHQRVAEEG